MDRLIARTVRKRLPLSVHFDLTYRCNERCVHCYLDHEDHGELSTAECIDALEQLAKAGTLFLTFSGGEIFLRRDLEELLATARRVALCRCGENNGPPGPPPRAGEALPGGAPRGSR